MKRFFLACLISSMTFPPSLIAGSYGPDFSDVIPDDRRTDWSQAGVPGGIRNRTTIFRSVKRAPDNPQTTTGNISANSDQLTVVNSVDFEVGHGIGIDDATCKIYSNPCEPVEFGTTVKEINGNVITLNRPVSRAVSNVLVRHVNGPAIQEALDECPADQVVYLPEGVWQNVGGLTTQYKGHVTLRGAGMGRTILERGEITIGGGWDWLWDKWNALITGSPTKSLNGEPSVLNVGSTAFLDSLPDGGIGRMVEVRRKNDMSTPVMSGFEYVQRQKSRIIAKTATTVTISPGLVFDLPASLEPRIVIAERLAEFVGIEDLTFDGKGESGGYGFIIMDQTYGCWVKNVGLLNAKNRNLWIAHALQCEIRGSRVGNLIVDTTPNHSGLQFGRSSFCLLEDNIFNRQFPVSQMNDGSSGNVFAYNYCDTGNLNTNHAPHNSFNLLEGNVFKNSAIQNDGYHGSGSDDTVYRNRFFGGHCVILNRFTRRYNVIGNILTSPGRPHLGTHPSNGFMPLPPSEWGNYDTYAFSFGNPNLGNGSWTGTASLINGDPWIDWAAWINGTFGKPLGTDGVFQELDLDVGGTTLLKGNFTFVNGGEIHPMEALNGVVLPASLFRSSKPAYFGNLAWPPFDSTNGLATADNKIPAQVRFEGGIVPDPDPFAPVITIHPTSKVAVEGDFVQFAVEAAGFPLPSYQWRKNGVAINGATGTSLSISAAAVADSGASYTVAVQNNLGQVITNPAVLTVIPKSEAPIVSITKPSNGAQIAANTPITIEAAASDPNGTIAKVDFYNGSVLLGTDTSSPYSFIWQYPNGGTHSLTARATDNSGAAVRSAAVQVTVAGGTNNGGGGGSGESLPVAAGTFGLFNSVLDLSQTSEMPIVLELAQAGTVHLRVRSRSGADVAILKNNESMSAGSQIVNWNGRNKNGDVVASGMYLLILTTGDNKSTKKIVVVK